jgi:hypothetical protein
VLPVADWKKVSNGSWLMIGLPLDVVMQNVWTLTAFVNLASRQGQIRAAFFLAGFISISNTTPIASVKITRIDGLLGTLWLGYWRGENGESCREVFSGTAGEAKSWKPCSYEVRRAKCSKGMSRLPCFLPFADIPASSAIF